MIKKYFSKITKSTYSVEHYIAALKKPLNSSLAFFLVTMLLLGLGRGAYFGIYDLPEFKAKTYQVFTELEENFEDELEVHWADEQLEINRETLRVDWPSSVNTVTYNLPSTLAIISNSEIPANEFDEIDPTPFVYINQNNFYTLNARKNWIERPLINFFGEIKSYTINKQNLPKIISQVKQEIERSFIALQLFSGMVTLIIFLLQKIWFLITETILVYFLFWIYQLGFSFKKTLKLCLNILVPTELVSLVVLLLYGTVQLPMTSITFWILVSYISFHLMQQKLKMKK